MTIMIGRTVAESAKVDVICVFSTRACLFTYPVLYLRYLATVSLDLSLGRRGG